MKELLPKELDVLQHLTLEIYGYLVDERGYYLEAFNDATFLAVVMIGKIQRFFKKYGSYKMVRSFDSADCLDSSHFTALKIIKTIINSKKPADYNGEILSDKNGGVGLDELVTEALTTGLSSIFSENHLRYKNDL